jgi:hypothetical protein
MIRRFNSAAGQERAAYLSTLLAAGWRAVRERWATLRAAAAAVDADTAAVPLMRRGTPSGMGRL